MPCIGLSGVRIHVRVQSARAVDAPTVVLLHGLGSSSADWTPQLAAFSRRFKVLAVDLPGHGRSTRGRGPFRVPRLARDVSQALDTLGAPAVHVVGLSLGGCVGLELALREPARVRSLTLVNAFAKLTPSGARGVARMLHRLALACVAPMPVLAGHVARGLFPRPEQRELYRAAVASLGAGSRRTYLASLRALATFDARTRLSSIRCPTLVVVGEGDATVPRAAGERLAHAIPGARLVVIPASGHATPHDQPDRFNTVVMEFLSRLG
ncbi:MAG: alpha/beta fold hydrolase [Candidatus Rokubacteria bacterium]|nr:alpha/beta fold hydrolase [Candidatus Rokubacteria bacterium]